MALLLQGACGETDPERKVQAITRGDELYGSAQFSEAAMAFQTAVAIDPKDGAARLKLAMSYRQAEKWEDAAREGVRAADLLPDSLEAQRLGVWSLNAQGRFVDAADWGTRVMRRYVNDPELLALWGNARARFYGSYWALALFEVALRNGPAFETQRNELRANRNLADLQAAEEAYRTSLNIDPQMHEARFGLVSILWVGGREDEGAAELRLAIQRDPDNDFLRRTLGLFYAYSGNAAEAVKHLEAAASSGGRESQIALADFYVSNNRGGDALPILDKAAATGDPDGAATLRAADIEIRLGRSEQAVRRAEEVLSRNSLNPHALRIKAEVLLSRNQIDEATKLARASVEGAPKSGASRRVLGLALAASAEYRRAFDELAESWRLDSRDPDVAAHAAHAALMLRRDQAAIEFARQTLRLRPGQRLAATVLVSALTRVGNLAAARQALSPLLSVQPIPADALTLQGGLQVAEGKPDAARASYRRALQVAPNAFDALAGLVALELRDGQGAQALPLVTQATKAHPNDVRFGILAARLQAASGDATRAEATLRSVLQVNPSHTDAVLLLADILIRQKRGSEAIRVMEQVLERRPESIELQSMLARSLEASGRVEEAQKRYERIVRDDPTAHDAGIRLALLHAGRAGNLNVALALATAAKRDRPDDPAASDALGWVYERRGLETVAIPHLQDAVRKEPSNPTYRYHLGVAYQRSRQVQKAREELSLALKLSADFPEAAEAKSVLEMLGR